jgi:hypothetical protein
MNVSKFLKFVDLSRDENEKEIIKKALSEYAEKYKRPEPTNSQAFIYRIVCKDSNINDCYVGHTFKPICMRVYHHRKTCENQGYRYHNKKLYRFIRANGGFDNFTIEIIEGGIMDKFGARIREQFWIDNYNPTLNKIDSQRK